MPKAYVISCYREVKDAGRLQDYAKLAGPAIIAGGGTFLARGTAAKTMEQGVKERTVIIEFPSVDMAVAAHDSPGYQAALAALDGGAVRDLLLGLRVSEEDERMGLDISSHGESAYNR